MKASRYDLHVKVPGQHKPFYVVRRRILDGGFECNCPRWNEQREECKHVRPVKAAMATLPKVPSPLESAIEKTVRMFPWHIPSEDDLVRRLLAAVRNFS
jgi:hypothetical protein